MPVFKIERLVKGPADAAWEVIADVVGYADLAPNISRIEHLDGEGVGLRRRCYDNRDRGWNEVCPAWEAGREYTMVVDTSADDYPYPLRKMRGTWRVVEQPDGVLLQMEFDYAVKGPLGGLFGRSMQPMFKRVTEKLLDNWEAKIRERSGRG